MGQKDDAVIPVGSTGPSMKLRMPGSLSVGDAVLDSPERTASSVASSNVSSRHLARLHPSVDSPLFKRLARPLPSDVYAALHDLAQVQVNSIVNHRAAVEPHIILEATVWSARQDFTFSCVEIILTEASRHGHRFAQLLLSHSLAPEGDI